MKPTGNKLILEWIPTTKVGLIHLPSSELDFWNTDSVKMFKVIAAGPGSYTRKGVFVPNEVQPGDNVILDCRTGGRPEPLDGMNGKRFILADPTRAIAVCPAQSPTSG